MPWKQLGASLRKSFYWSFLTVPVLLGAFFYVAYLSGKDGGADLSVFFNDANSINNQPFFYGSIEYLTSSLMMMTGAILVFCAMTEKTAGPFTCRFAFSFGAFTMFLGFDDLFMFHESFYLLVPFMEEDTLYAVYGIILLTICGAYYRLILQSPFFILGGALTCLMFSGLEDVFAWRPFSLPMEEYFELVAFVAWPVYALATAFMIRWHQIGIQNFGARDRQALRKAFAPGAGKKPEVIAEQRQDENAA
jgi:hypothetical protein